MLDRTLFNSVCAQDMELKQEKKSRKETRKAAVKYELYCSASGVMMVTIIRERNHKPQKLISVLLLLLCQDINTLLTQSYT